MANIPVYEQKILEEVGFLKDRYFPYDEPIPFCGMAMIPVTMRHYQEFMGASACLTIRKNDDIQGIKRTNLEYLLYKIKDAKEGAIWSSRLSKIIELCLGVAPGFRCHKCGKRMTYEEYLTKYQVLTSQPNCTQEQVNTLGICPDCNEPFVASLNATTDQETGREALLVDGHIINSEEFNRFRKIVLYQNLPDYYDDSFDNKALIEDERKKHELLSRDAGSATTEEKICAVAFQAGMSLNNVYDLTVRKFMIFSRMINDYTEYFATKIGLSSGMVKLKDGQKIEHWLYKNPKENRYGASVSADELIKGVSGS